MNSKSPRSSLEMMLSIIGVAAVALYFTGAPIHAVWLMWITKPIPVLCLAGLVASWSPRRDLYRDMLMVGFVLSAIGDVFMMKDKFFIFGLGSFLLAHICYVVAFSSSAQPRVRLRPELLLPFVLYGGLMLWFLWPGLGDLRVPVLMYVSVILTMGWRAAARLGQPGEQRPAHWFGLVGAVLFIFSDSIIAIGKFHGAVPAERLLIMGTYWAGQLGIAMSVARRARAESQEN